MTLLLETASRIATERIALRNYRNGDRMPEEFKLNVPVIDHQWVWVAAEEGRIVAAVFAGTYHGAVFIGNIFSLKRRKPALGLLLRQFVRDAIARGYSAYFTFLDCKNNKEGRLLRILRKSNCVVHDSLLAPVAGRFSDLERW